MLQTKKTVRVEKQITKSAAPKAKKISVTTKIRAGRTHVKLS